MTRVRRSVLAAAVFICAPAFAQSPPTAPKPNDTAPQSAAEPRDNRACAPQQRATVTPDGKADASTNASGNLSDRLAKTDGVICPPSNVDPEIKSPAPQSGSAMPVIPPPGAPGGDPSVRPK